MFSKHLFIILSAIILVSSTLGQNCPFIECPPEWKMWRRSCYRFTPKLSWVDAKTSCQAMGGEMAVPRSQVENDFFLSFGEDENVGNFIWIDCQDRSVEGQWMCNNIEITAVFTYWYSGEPNNWGDEDCATTKSLNGQWHDVSCTRHYPAMCKRAP